MDKFCFVGRISALETPADSLNHHNFGGDGGLPPGRKALSYRAKQRLKIAAGFLRKAGHKFSGDDFYQLVLDALDDLEDNERHALREIVDWVEDYCQHEM